MAPTWVDQEAEHFDGLEGGEGALFADDVRRGVFVAGDDPEAVVGFRREAGRFLFWLRAL